MSNLFEMLLKVGFDKNSANAEYQKLVTELKKNKFQVTPDINFAKSKQEIEKQVVDIAKIFKDGLKIDDDKVAKRYAQSYYNAVVKGAKAAQAEQLKLNNLQQKNSKDYWQGRFKDSVSDLTKTNSELANMKQYYSAIEAEQSKLNALNKKNDSNYWQGNFKESLQSMTKTNDELVKMREYYKQIGTEQLKSDAFSRDKSSAINKINSFIKENSNLTQTSIEKLNNFATAMESATNPNDLRNLKNETNNLQRSLKAAGETGRNFGDEMKNNFKKFSTWVGASAIFFGVQRAIRGVIDDVKELDTAMTSLYKVTDETDTKYNSFLQSAYKNSQKLGQSVTNLVEQTAQWAKLGYGIDEAAKLAEVSSIYANVGEVDNATAVSDMVTAMKAYRIETQKAMSVIDPLNKLGNEFATSAADLGDGLKKSASALALGGTDMYKALAMLTGGAEITQDAGEMGNMLKVGQMRVMSMKGALQELGEEYEDLESVSKMQTKILNLTEGQVNIMNDADPTKFKDYYDILEGVAKVYKTLDQTSQMDLTETLFGKMRGNQGAALLQAFMSGQVQKALDTAKNSAGSATEEQERWLKSIEAKQQQLVASTQEFSNTFLNSSLIKNSVDGLNLIISGLTDVTKLLGTIPTLATIAFGAIGAKGYGKHTPICPVYT